ncbi:MAG: TonB-dependent receptor [Kofleriaceae bacterium]|jgi:outer membrane cobalamin receptor|nr:TonB-dependent receptor [Kofleriaceae bacterium]MBP9169272.1 TonB-dependent receptor [Kofleriaceae bacterium]MBP9859019.1 TonB-dependent receptor [Kofleriaceae bacterium]
MRGRDLALSSLILVAAAATASADPVVGNVLDGGTLKPVAGATVVIGETTVTTGKAGQFTVDLPAGPVMVTISAPGYDDASEEIIVPDGGIVDYIALIYRPGAALETVEIEDDAPVPPPPGKQDVPREQITRIPGARGDALTAVRSLPGVGNAVGGGSGPGLVVIRGAAPEDSKITIDGVEVPVLYHFFGLQSVLPSEFIANIEFLPGGFGADEGRSTGGVINVVTRDEAAPNTTGFAELSFINLAGFIQTPLSKKHGVTLTAAARRSVIDFILPVVLGDTVNFTTAPTYYDGQLRVDWRRREGEKFSLLALTSFDLLSLISNEFDPNEPEFTGFDNETSFSKAIAQWTRARGEWSNRLVAALGTSGFRVEIGDDRFIKVNRYTAELRDDLAWTPNKTWKVRAGAEVRYDPREVNVRFPQQPPEGQPPPSNFSTLPLIEQQLNFSNSVAATYLATDWRPDKETAITGGLRLDYYDRLGEVTLSPRLQVVRELDDQLTARGAVGLYTRNFEFGESIPDYVAPETAWQFVAGVDVKLAPSLTASTTGFYTARQSLLTVDPLLAQTMPEQSYVNSGTGRSYGVEYLVKAQYPKFFGWLAYTYSRSDRIDRDGAMRRLFDFDQTHNLIAVGSWKLGNWEIGARWQYATGQPETPVTGSLYLADANAYIAQYGPVNSARIEDYHAADLRIDRKWKWDGFQLSAYLDITNVYAHARVLGYSYNFDFTEREPITELPILPALGVRGSF